MKTVCLVDKKSQNSLYIKTKGSKHFKTIGLDLVCFLKKSVYVLYLFIHVLYWKKKGVRKLVPHITDSDIFKTFSKQKGIPLKTTLKKAFTWLHRTFHKIWETKKAHFWARLDDAVFDSWSEWKGQKGWKAQCEHPSLHWKRELGCSFYLNCCLLLFFFGENMQDNMKTKFQQPIATLFPRPWKNMFFFAKQHWISQFSWILYS